MPERITMQDPAITPDLIAARMDGHDVGFAFDGEETHHEGDNVTLKRMVRD